MMTLRFALRLITIFSLTAAALTAAERPYGVDPMQAVTLADRLEIWSQPHLLNSMTLRRQRLHRSHFTIR